MRVPIRSSLGPVTTLFLFQCRHWGNPCTREPSGTWSRRSHPLPDPVPHPPIPSNLTTSIRPTHTTSSYENVEGSEVCKVNYVRFDVADLSLFSDRSNSTASLPCFNVKIRPPLIQPAKRNFIGSISSAVVPPELTSGRVPLGSCCLSFAQRKSCSSTAPPALRFCPKRIRRALR